MENVIIFLSDSLDDLAGAGAQENSTVFKTFLKAKTLAVQHVNAARAKIQKAPKRNRQENILPSPAEAQIEGMQTAAASIAPARSVSIPV